jgi:hypothetical protein
VRRDGASGINRPIRAPKVRLLFDQWPPYHHDYAMIGSAFSSSEVAMKLMKRSLMLTAAAMLLVGGTANAQNLKGTWSFVGNDNCVIGGPFSNNDSGDPAQAANYVANGGVQGFAVFKGDGTGTITLGAVGIWARYVNNTGVASVDHFEAYTISNTIMFTYVVTGDEFTLSETSDTGQFTSNQFGRPFLKITGAPTVNGTMSQHSPPVLQTMTGTPASELWDWGPIGIGPLAAMCVRTRTYTKVKDQPPATK